MNSAAPWRNIGEFAIEELLDAFGGDCEKIGVKDDKGGIGSKTRRGLGWTRTARVTNKKLATQAADEFRRCLRLCRNREQEETEVVKISEAPIAAPEYQGCVKRY